SAVSTLLAKEGFAVLLLDRATFPRDKACGEYTSPETAKVLARLGALEAVEGAGGRRLRSMDLVSPSLRRFALEYGPTRAESDLYILATTRRVLDATLVDHARKSGVELRERV